MGWIDSELVGQLIEVEFTLINSGFNQAGSEKRISFGPCFLLTFRALLLCYEEVKMITTTALTLIIILIILIGLVGITTFVARMIG